MGVLNSERTLRHTARPPFRCVLITTARSIGGLRDDTLVERLRHAVVDVDAGLRVREGGLEPIDLSLADGQPTLEEGPVD